MQPNDNRQLGRLPSRHDPRTLNLAKYLRPDLPPPPPTRTWNAAVPEWGLGGNDQYGNCVIVSAAHEILLWNACARSKIKPISDQQIIELSAQLGALNGYNILDRLNYWRQYGMWRNAILAYAAINPQQPDEVKQTIALGGIADIGLNLPLAWRHSKTWDIGHGPAYRPGTWGGHSVPLVGYDHNQAICITWGREQAITWPALYEYCDEGYAIIDPSWIQPDGNAPSGLDLNALLADLTTATR
jgi:hypothetical protein